MAKLLTSGLALVLVTLKSELPIAAQAFLIGILPVWAEVVTSLILKYEPARETKKRRLYFDAFADTTSFLFIPLFWWNRVNDFPLELLLFSLIFFSAGLLRIIRFLSHGLDNSGYFQGLPVTYTGYLWIILTLLPHGSHYILDGILLLILSWLMMTQRKLIKAPQ